MANKSKKRLTPKQKKLLALLPSVATGDMTMEAAMLKAGYSKSTSEQQTQTLKNIRTNSVMQEALEKAGFTESFIAETLVKDIKLLRPGQARRAYLELGSKLKDAFPATKNINADVGIADLIKAQEATTPTNGK